MKATSRLMAVMLALVSFFFSTAGFAATYVYNFTDDTGTPDKETATIATLTVSDVGQNDVGQNKVSFSLAATKLIDGLGDKTHSPYINYLWVNYANVNAPLAAEGLANGVVFDYGNDWTASGYKHFEAKLDFPNQNSVKKGEYKVDSGHNTSWSVSGTSLAASSFNYFATKKDYPNAYAMIRINGAADGNSRHYISISPVPEPEAWVMMTAGLGLLGARLSRRTKRQVNAGRSAVA